MTTTDDAQSFPTESHLEAERIRAHLRKVVKESTLTRKELAKRAKITPAILSNVLREGGPGFHVDRVEHILKAIGVDPLKFYGEMYPEKPSP